MTLASDEADISRQKVVTAAQIEALGGAWDHARQAYVFPDGSAGCFIKDGPVLKQPADQFSHYRFQEQIHDRR